MNGKAAYLFVVWAIAGNVAAQELPGGDTGLSKSAGGAGIAINTNRIVGGRIELKDSVGRGSAKINQEKRNERLAHGRDDICLDFDGEKLTWGDLEDYVELQLKASPLNIPPQATLEQVNTIIANSKIRMEEIAANAYLKEALLAAEAKKANLSITEEELSAALKKAVEKSVGRGGDGEVAAQLLKKDGYFARRQANYLLTRKYREQILAPAIEVTPAELAECIADRRRANESAAATNTLLRAKIEDLYRKIRSGKLDFGEAAYEYSDCGSSMDNGDWGFFDADNNNLLQPLKDFIFAPSMAQMSKVIETPYSYHIIKILERCYDDDDEHEAASVAPARQSSPANAAVPLAAIALAALALSVLSALALRRRSVRARIATCGAIWAAGAIAGVGFFAALAPETEARSPSRVHVQQIMLEKTPILPELDEQSAADEVRRQKLGERTRQAQAAALEKAMAEGKLKSEVKITLLHKKTKSSKGGKK
ncbi:MAG: peptidylprolyl isomerase [Kiritimatiellia bacterium]